jgi:methyl-accepting chemotaxis protein
MKMILETAKSLNELTLSGEYKSHYEQSKALEEMNALVNKLKAEVNNLNPKSDIMQDFVKEFISDLENSEQYLNEAINKIDSIEAEIEQECGEYSAHQGYCQEVFDRR